MHNNKVNSYMALGPVYNALFYEYIAKGPCSFLDWKPLVWGFNKKKQKNNIHQLEVVRKSQRLTTTAPYFSFLKRGCTVSNCGLTQYKSEQIMETANFIKAFCWGSATTHWLASPSSIMHEQNKPNYKEIKWIKHKTREAVCVSTRW